jgi:hypothetical protein
MFFIEMLPYHVVPPSGVKKTQMSIALAVVVREREAAPLANLNVPPDQATVRPAVASFVSISVNEEEPVAIGAERVKVQLPVNVAVKTFPLVQVMVVAVPEFPRATTVSAYATG